MRRIYDSDALVRDTDPHTPVEADRSRNRGAINWAAASHALTPVRVRDWAVSVAIETDRATYAPGESVHMRFTFHNRLPIPVRLVTESPIRWRWAVDDAIGASRVAPRSPPARRTTFEFGRGERKVFRRTWDQSIRRTDREWRPVDPGTYTLAVWVGVENAKSRGVYDDTVVRIES